MRIGTLALLSIASALTPFMCGASTTAAEWEQPPSGAFVDSGLKPPPDIKPRLDGGSLRPADASALPDAAGPPDRIVPPMAPDSAILDARPQPLAADHE